MRHDSARSLVILLVLAFAAPALAPLAAASYPQGPPNDPSYAPAEGGGDDTCERVSVNDEQHYLYSFMPRCAPNASDPENSSGMFLDLAWARHTTGSPEVVIAYVEGGINWHSGDARDLVDKIWLNRGELPHPRDASGQTSPHHDANGDGRFNSKDYSGDARVTDANGNGLLDAEDLIVAFSDGVDDDRNGFVDDVSGWDFYNGQNDPASVDATYDHANGQMRQAAAETNNGFMGAGVCPDCMLMPIKAGAEALDRTDDLAQAWLYAGTMGADVIVSVTADLGYSSFMGEVVDALWRAGVVMVAASNDFDSTDHQGGMFWPHVLPGNGLVTNSRGLPEAWTSNQATTTFRTRSDMTSWGTKSMFSVATQGGSTSTSTPTTGGVVGMVLSYGLEAAREGLIARPLTGPEAIQVLMATASDIDDPTLNWPGKPGWDLQYGYGRPNVLKAIEAVAAGQIPPTPSIEAPDWYALYDPTRTAHVAVEGRLEAARADSYSWTLEWALGAEPADDEFKVIGHGAGHAPREGVLGAIDLSEVPPEFYEAPYEMSETKALETTEMYTLTIRLRITDERGIWGEDRRTIAVHRDPDWLPGFPVKFGIGGESQPALFDLQGLGRDAIVFADADGRVHAWDAVHGRELPGWPVTTDRTETDGPIGGIDAGHEPVLAPVSVGDLDRDGRPEVVATSTVGKVYVFDENGHRVHGWPKSVADHAVTPDVPRPALQYTRLPHAGATASPVLHDMDGDGRLDVIQASWDGHVYVFRDDGTPLPGWPVRVRLPDGHEMPDGHVLINDHKLISTPAVADLDGDGDWELVVMSQYTHTTGAGLQLQHYAHAFAFHADGAPVAGWPVDVPGVAMYYGSGQEFITEQSTAPAVADVDLDGRDEVAVSPTLSPTLLLAGDGSIRAVYGAGANPLAEVLAGNLAAPEPGNLPADVPVTFTTSGAFGRIGGTLSFAQAGSGAASTATALLLTGSGAAIKNYERAYDAATGAPRPGFPALLQGLNFLGAPIIVDVDGDGLGDVVDGADSSTFHAFTSAGTLVEGFPKFTSGWTLFSPAAGDVDGDGKLDLVTTTREGYLFAWRTDGDASAREWRTYHHDERRTGRYGTDTLPPGPLADVRVDAHAGVVSFVAPGDDGLAGRVKEYRIIAADGVAWSVPATAAAGAREALALPAGAGLVTVQAVDEAGNAGRPSEVEAPAGDAALALWLPPVIGVAGVALRLGAGRLRRA